MSFDMAVHDFFSKTLSSWFHSLRGSSISLISSIGASSLTVPWLLKLCRVPSKPCSSLICLLATVNTCRLKVPNALLYFSHLFWATDACIQLAYATSSLGNVPGILDSVFTQDLCFPLNHKHNQSCSSVFPVCINGTPSYLDGQAILD